MKGLLIVISAPSGTGKSTVVRRLLARMPRLIHSVSCTTRAPRTGETDGVDYHFVTEKEFEHRIQRGYFLEWAKVHDASYGTPRRPIDDAIARGMGILLDIDVQGGMAIKQAFPDALTIFLLPPSLTILEERLKDRATDNRETMRVRLENAKGEMAYQNRYDDRVVNDDLDRAVESIERLITSRLGSQGSTP